jgi:ribosomal protein S18 acetylase RimI-like enzyme
LKAAATFPAEMVSIELRRVTPDDWEDWRALRLRALAEDPAAFGSTLAEWSGEGDTEVRWRRRLESVPLNLVAFVAGEAVGMVSATPLEDDLVELISMWVAPEARRTGVAKALIDETIGWARDEGASQVALDVRENNVSALALYRACGFVDVGESPNLGPDTPERRMSRRL